MRNGVVLKEKSSVELLCVIQVPSKVRRYVLGASEHTALLRAYRTGELARGTEPHSSSVIDGSPTTACCLPALCFSKPSEIALKSFTRLATYIKHSVK